MAAEDIILRIALSGDDDVVAKLGQIGNTGVSAFGKLESAVTGVSSVIAGITGAITGVAGGLFYWANAASNTVEKMSNLAGQSGSSISQMTALQGALSAAGADTDRLGAAFRQLALTIEARWQRIVEATRKSASDAVHEQTRIKDSLLSVEDAQDRLAEARQKSSELFGGDPLTEEEKQLQARVKALREVEKAENALTKAIQARDDAQEAAEQRERNAPATLQTAVEAVASGKQTVKQAGQSANLTFENVITGLVASAGPAAERLKDFSGNLSDLISQAPSVQEVFFKLADFMKHSGDDALNTALAYRVLGRGVGQDVVEAMKQGSGALQEYMDRLEKLGLVLTENDKKVSQDYLRSFHSLSGELHTTVTQLGLLFAPSFAEGFTKFREFIEKNHESILNFGRDIVDKVRPVILDFFDIISGDKEQANRTNFVRPLIDGFGKIASFIKQEVFPFVTGLFNAITGQDSPEGSKTEKWQQRFEAIGRFLRQEFETITTIIGAVKTAIDGVVGGFNKIFGTNLTTGEVVTVAILGKITGAFDLLTKAIGGTIGVVERFFGLIHGGGRGGGVLPSLLGGGAGAGGAGGAAGGGLSEAARIAHNLREAGLNSNQLSNLKDSLSTSPGSTLLGFGEGVIGGIGQGIGFLFINALKSPAVVATVGVAMGALLVEAIENARKKQKEAQTTIKPVELSDYVDPFSGVPLRTPEAERIRRGELNARIYQQQQAVTQAERERLVREGVMSLPPGVDLHPILPPDTGPNLSRLPRADANKLLDQLLYGGEGGRPLNESEGAQAITDAAGRLKDAASALKEGADDRRTRGEDGRPTRSDIDKTFRENKFFTGPDPTQGDNPFGVLQQQRSEVEPATNEASQGLTSVAQASDQADSAITDLAGKTSQLSSAFESAAQAIQASAQQIAQAGNSGSGSSGGVTEAAEGGLVYGPGGPTSDTVPAMLSPGEFIVNASGSNLMDAVRHFGRRMAEGGFVDTINTTLLGAGDVFKQVAKIASPSLPPHYGTIDLRTNAGDIKAIVHNSNMAQLQDGLSRLSVSGSVRSGGIKPSWYGK